MAVWAVHRLTRNREREKAVFDLYKMIGESIGPLKEAAVRGWTSRAGPDRRTAVAETKWRLQQLGGSVERLRKLSKRRRAISWPPFQDVSIRLTNAMKDLRDIITQDPFEDPTRKANRAQSEEVERAIGSFLSTLDERFFVWIK